MEGLPQAHRPEAPWATKAQCQLNAGQRPTSSTCETLLGPASPGGTREANGAATSTVEWPVVINGLQLYSPLPSSTSWP